MKASPASPVKARVLACPSCGGRVEIRGFQNTRSVVCIQCLSVLDPTTPEITILQKFDERLRVTPLVPLGSRGKLRGTLYEIIGFQVRTITVEGEDYSWHEYLAFNPFKGFRYLTQYNGHWNDVIPLQTLPSFTQKSGRKAAVHLGTTYQHFQTATARTTFVMGEFPWQVRVGETAQVEDYISPPQMLSAEITDGEVTWSLGEYMTGAEVWQAFQLKGGPPPARGIYANQPAPPTKGSGGMWGAFAKLFLAWLVLLIGMRLFSSNQQVLQQGVRLANQESVVTNEFALGGRNANVEVEMQTSGAGYFHMALVSREGGRSIEFARNVGGREKVTVPDVPPGRYYLRIEPEIEEGSPFDGQVTVRRDVPGSLWLWVSLLFLLLPPIFRTAQSGSFEAQRWQESDYAQ